MIYAVPLWMQTMQRDHSLKKKKKNREVFTSDGDLFGARFDPPNRNLWLCLADGDTIRLTSVPTSIS